MGYGRVWGGGSVSTAVYHRDIRDSFFRIFAIDDSNPNYDIVNRIFENAGNSTQTGVEVLLEQEIGDSWRLSGSVNWYQNDIDAFETTLLFPTRRPFALAASEENTWDVTLNNQIQLPGAFEGPNPGSPHTARAHGQLRRSVMFESASNVFEMNR